MFSYHLRRILLKQKKQLSLIAVIHFICFLLLGFLSHAKEMQKIKTPHFSIGFHKSATRSAEHIANTLETIYKPVSKTLGVYPSSIRLLINNQSTELNGFFNTIPRHICFYTLYHPDPYFIGNADWLSMLCIHEFRHAVQYSIEYHSTPLWLRPLYFGGNLISICGISSFFKEGDAVGIETALSKSGRGRLPGWEKLYRVNLLERNAVSFSRQLFGSLKYEMPSEYHIGYYFTTHIRRRYGANAIRSIFEKSMRSIPFFGFYHAIKAVTNKSILKVYEEMNQELRLSWQKQLEGLKITPATQLTIKKPNDSFDYIHPFIDASGNLMAWKKGIGLRDQLVQVRFTSAESATPGTKPISSQKDKTLLYFIKDSLPPAAFAIGEGCAAWLEQCRHPWKGNKQTIRLQYYDLKQRKRRTLVSSSRYIALAMSPSTHQLVAVTTDKSGKHILVVLETKSGKEVKKLDNPDEGYYLTPSWSDEDHLVVVKTKDQKNSILRINVTTNKTETLLPYSYEHRSYPRIYQDYLLYNSSYNGIDNIYAMHLPTKACFQVTSRKYGAYLGMVDPINNQLVFSDYTKNGMEIAVMPFNPLLWTPLEAVEDRSVRYYEPLVAQEQNGTILDKVPDHLYPTTKYHSIRDNLALIGANITPNWEDRGLQIEPFTLVNLKDTLKVTPYFYQNFNLFNKARVIGHKTSELGLKISYTTWYPILEIDLKSTRHKQNSLVMGMPDSFRTDCKFPCQMVCLIPSNKIFWTPELNLRIKLPYYFTLNSSLGEAYIGTEVHVSRSNERKKISCRQAYTFGIKNFSTRSKRDIHAPWYQELDINFQAMQKNISIYEEHQRILCCNAKFYIPGIGCHHYVSLSPTIRRFKHTVHKPYWEQSINLVYGFPLAYPECGIPLIWFLERIWIEGYCNMRPRSLSQTSNTSCTPPYSNEDPIFDSGIKIYFSNRFLLNHNIPSVTISVDFDFCKKQNNGWNFEFPLPKFSLVVRPR